MAESLLQVFNSIVIFLELDVIESMPHTLALSLEFFPPELRRDVMDFMCLQLLPLTLGVARNSEVRNFTCDSVPTIMMSVFHLSSNPG